MNNKNFDSSWYTDIPTCWREYTIGSLFNTRNEKVNDTDYQPLSVTKNGIVLQMENVAKSDANDNRKKVLINDFVINSRSDRKQSCGVSKLDGSVSLINTVLYRKNSDYLLDKYPNYLMKNYGFAEEFYRWGHGIVADLWTTKWQEMKSIKLPVPPLSTQIEIQKILDKKCSQIDRLIAIQEQEIEKLKAYKQSLITEVVTKGLDPNVEMKDSGVDWITEIPKNWEAKPIKTLFTFSKGLSITKENLQESGAPVISYGQIHAKWNSGVTLHEELKRYVSENYFESSKTSLAHKGDFIFADTSEDLSGCGNCAYIDKNESVFAGYHTVILRPTQNVDTKYLAYLFLTDAWRSQIRQRVYGIKLFSVTQKILKNLSVIIPDNCEPIIKFLDEKCAHIDLLVSMKEQKISYLNNYRKSLIYEYVTGKKEV